MDTNVVSSPRCEECIYFSHFEWLKFEGTEPKEWYHCNRRNRAVHPQTYWCEATHFESRVKARYRYKDLWSITAAHHSIHGMEIKKAIRHGDEAVRLLIEYDDWEKEVEKPKWSVTADMDGS